MRNARSLGKKVNITATPVQPPQPSPLQGSTSSSGLTISTTPVVANQLNNVGVVGQLLQSLVNQQAGIPTELPTDESIAYDDPDINKRYEELQKLLLNPIRTEIISIAEFIPITSGDPINDNTASLNLNLGDQSKITVSNAARLIELHRQIREYITNSATVLFQTLYPVKSSEDFLAYLKKATIDNIDDVVQILPTNSQQRGNSNLIKSTINNVIQLIKEGYTGDFENSSTYIALIKENENDPFVKGLIEYFLYEFVILDVIKMYGSVATVGEKLVDNWQIDKSLQTKPFNPSTAFTNSNISLAYQENADLNLYSPNDIDKKIIGIKRENMDSDYDMLFNLFANICSLVLHKDSVAFLQSYKEGSQKISRNPGDIIYGLSGDLGRLINRVKNVNQVSFLKGPDSRTRLGGTPTENFNSDSSLFNFYKQDIVNALGEAPINHEIVSELLSAMMFDASAFEINFKIATSNAIKNLIKWNDLQPNEEKSAYYGLRYLSDMFNINVTPYELENNYDKNKIRSSGIPYEVPSNQLNTTTKEIFGFGNIFKNIGTARYFAEVSQENVGTRSNIPYLPLESTNNELVSDTTAGEIGRTLSESYLTGPEYFFTQNLSKDIVDFSDMDKFTADYKGEINKFINNFFVFFPDHDIAKLSSNGSIGDPLGSNHNPLRFAIRLLSNFANNDITRMISDINTNNSCVPMLASWLNRPSQTSKRDVLQAMYWTYVAMSQHTKIAKSDDENQVTEGSVKDIYSLCGDLIEYYNEKVSKDFLENLFGTMRSGAVGNRNFPTGGSYKVWMGADGNPYNGTEVRDASLTNFNINNDGGKNKSYGGNVKNWTTTRRYLDNKFDACFSGNDDRLKNISAKYPNGRKRIDLEDAPGFAKLIKSSLMLIADYNHKGSDRQKYNSHSVWKGESNIYNYETRFVRRIGTLNNFSNYDWIDKPLNFPGTHGFSSHQRVLAWFYWVNSLLTETITIKATTAAGNKAKHDVFKLSIDENQFQGLKQGIKDAIKVINGNEVTITYPSDAFKEAYDEAKKRALSLLTVIKKRQDYIKDAVGLLAAHADNLTGASGEALNAVEGNDASGTYSKKRALSKRIVKNQSIDPEDILPLITKLTPANMYDAYNRYFKRMDNSLFATDIKYSLVKNKLIYKVLSQPGYGFLSNEKRGNKSIINVGLPASMINSLQTKAFKETRNANFKHSPYVSINIYKKDHLNDELVLLPKSYVFDTSALIQDYKIVSNERRLTNHLNNFSGDKSFDQILKSIEVTRIGTNYIDNTSQFKNSIGYPNGIFDREVMINHVFDYALKEYSLLTTGLDYSSQTFLLKRDALNLNKVVASGGVGQDIVSEFEQLITKINQIYPETLNDPQLASEVFRLVRVLKNSIPFSNSNRIKKVLYPSAFDRIYSIFINEKDFVIASDENNNFRPGLFINNSTPSFKPNSKLSRPDTNFGNFDFSVVKKYSKSCKENYPEVYNYYAVVSLLPLDFVEGAEDKFMTDESVISIDNATVVPAATLGVPSGLGFRP